MSSFRTHLEADVEPKPCPFCAGTNFDVTDHGTDSYFVVCLRCGALGPQRDGELVQRDYEAVDLWQAQGDWESTMRAILDERLKEAIEDGEEPKVETSPVCNPASP